MAGRELGGVHDVGYNQLSIHGDRGDGARIKLHRRDGPPPLAPMPTEIVSPAYILLEVANFPLSDGMTPVTSCGRSIPVF